MASAGYWDTAKTDVPVGPIQVKIKELYNTDWKKLNVTGTANSAVKSIEYSINSSGVVLFRYKTNETTDFRVVNSIQSIADDVYVAQIGYSTKTTELIKSRLQNDLNSLATQNSAPVPETQPTPPDNSPGEQSTTSPGSPTSFEITSDKFQTDGAYKPGFLHYPINMDPGQDRIVIVQSRYERPDVLNKSGGIDLNKIIAGAFSKERAFTKNLGTVVLPMPNDISETNVTAWGEDSLSSLAALVGGAALGTVTGLADFNLESAITAATTAAGNALGRDTAANEIVKQLLALNAAAAVTQKFGININPEAFRSRITGTAINPNLELLFQGPKLRSFGFQFKMTPRSEKEAQNIRYILKFFKKGMAPKRSTTDASGSYFLGAPNVFNIYFRSSDKTSDSLKSIGKIKTCALQQCAINYTPDGFYSAFNDSLAGGSQPISVTMQLAFTELTPIYNDNYDESDENSIGFDNLENISYGEPPKKDTGGGDVSPSGPPRGGTSGPASPTRPFTPGGSTNVPVLDFDPNAPGNSPVLGPGGVRGI